MTAQLRACLWLLGLTVVICCVLYPLVLWGVGKAAFPEQAEGSLVLGSDGKTVVGSRLIAQAFSGEQYFQPRPSAVSYKADASGASNWGASNPQLRERIARQLGSVARYARGPKAGRPVGPDVEAWYREKPDRVSPWTKETPTSAEIRAACFEPWLRAHPDVELEPVPADMVTTSGSGLDPDITLENALYQLPDVARARANRVVPNLDAERVREKIRALIDRLASRPMAGLVGPVRILNVLELNQELDRLQLQ
jgi:K+-transporting ATPase ATPase C chain